MLEFTNLFSLNENVSRETMNKKIDSFPFFPYSLSIIHKIC